MKKVNKLASLLLALVMCMALAVPAMAAEESKVQETYLTAEEISDGYIVYRDEMGAVVATRQELTQEEFSAQARAAVRPIDWTLQDGGTKHDSVQLDPTNGSITIYVSIDFAHTGKAYLGWYDTQGAYHWLGDYRTDGFYSAITLYSSSKVNLAIKNSCGTANRFRGNYSLAPF